MKTCSYKSKNWCGGLFAGLLGLCSITGAHAQIRGEAQGNTAIGEDNAATGGTNAQAQLVTPNVLVNPGAETGDLTGWTVGGNSNPGVDNGSFDPGINPYSGSYDFFGRNGSFGSLSQTVVLSSVSGITTTAIDSGAIEANVSFWEQGLDQGTPSDNGQITLTFLDGSSNTLGTVSTVVVDSHNGAWANDAETFAVPPGTRSIVYTMDFLRNAGTDNDSFIDDNSLTFTGVTPGDPFNGASLGNGWYYNSWVGYYNINLYPWIYHYNLGWIYVSTSNNTDLYLYVLNGNPAPMGWLYTHRSPYIYSFAKSAWLYYDQTGTSFYNFTMQAWENY